MRDSVVLRSEWRLRGHYREERLQEPETLDFCSEIVFAGYDSAIAHMKSVAVAASYDLYKTKPVWMEGSHEILSLTEELLAIDGCWSSKSQLSSRI